ncbi:TetR family transcriptional regulator [Mycobacterium intermedium]|uniref:TetR family transcriptional regulator n=2 Tax=Mycobacterium intermedium TaxID=28445 RepID=A0A1E3SIB8_MYCIE|nr:TetR family transcriptional regulator [Mycobacterium intermedium]OPE48825.1 TetR family transcriptional regulator [Mycobacterium intermedium]ORA98254.1 TetR family transcriptional regulator [Mycobacterium intermedium]
MSMKTVVSRPGGGRPPLIAVDDIVRVGRELGMRRLSVNAVAARLGVSATALYRHVENRWELERLVGESLLAELELREDPEEDLQRHLLSFALQMWHFVVDHPGLAAYLQVLFPRGDAGTRLLVTEVEALSRRGYSVDAAMVVSSAVATLAISLAAREESNASITGGEQANGFAQEREAVLDQLTANAQLGAAHVALPRLSSAQYVRLLLAASIRGLVGEIPPGRPINEVVAQHAAREDI